MTDTERLRLRLAVSGSAFALGFGVVAFLVASAGWAR
jgi:hypothetical protein